MKFTTFLINLDRSPERLENMDRQLNRIGIPYIRVSAVLGDQLAMPVENFDEIGFRIRTGKHRNMREIGCYFSHLKTLSQFLESVAPHALVLEDDAVLPDHIVPLLDDAISHASQWDILRLSSSREGEYINIQPLVQGHHLVVNTRVLKNTAAYLINRRGAEACLRHLQPMRLPYDVALDRDWTMDVRTACIHPFPVELADIPGQIPKAPRVRLFRSTTYHLFHLADHFRRKAYRHWIAGEMRSAADEWSKY